MTTTGSNMENFVSLTTLANDLNIDKSTMRKFALKSGITPQKRRTADSKNQLTLTVSREEADFLCARRYEQGFGSGQAVKTDIGVFYVIQLIPEIAPRRLKLGFADNIQQRLGQHRTSAPTAELVKAWPCKRSWERTVMDVLTITHGKLLINEVYEFDDIQGLVGRGDALFSLFPSPDETPALSEFSPYHKEL